MIISSKEGRRLHLSVITLRNKVVAHAESRYFPVRVVAAVLPPSSGRMGDFAIKNGQTYPRLDLRLLRSNAKQLAAVFGLHGHLAAFEVRRTTEAAAQEVIATAPCTPSAGRRY